MNYKPKHRTSSLRHGKFRLVFMALFFMVWLFSIPIAFLVVCILYPVLYVPGKRDNSFWGMVKSTIMEAHSRLVHGNANSALTGKIDIDYFQPGKETQSCKA
jgi:hypothetical protein